MDFGRFFGEKIVPEQRIPFLVVPHTIQPMTEGTSTKERIMDSALTAAAA